MNATTKRHRESARRLLIDIIEMLDMVGLGATSSRASTHSGQNGTGLREIPLTVPIHHPSAPAARTPGGLP